MSFMSFMSSCFKKTSCFRNQRNIIQIIPVLETRTLTLYRWYWSTATSALLKSITFPATNRDPKKISLDSRPHKKISECYSLGWNRKILPKECANLSQTVAPLPSSLTAPSYYKHHRFNKVHNSKKNRIINNWHWKKLFCSLHNY